MNTLSLIMFAMERNKIWDAIRSLLSVLDGVVYYFVSALLQTIFDISTIPFEADLMNSLSDKLYVILSIFMFFKIAISLITYLVNPDAMADKQVGAGKLVSRVIITMLMLLALPIAFRELTDEKLNRGILETLPRLLISANFDDGRDNPKSDPMASDGRAIGWAVLKGFITNNASCPGTEGYEISFNPFKAHAGYDEYDVFKNKKSNSTMVLENINLVCEEDKNEYYYEYSPVISTVAGAFLCYILVGIAINVGIRMFKLMILRIIAPIPIISYIDPKTGKDGPFNRWLKSIGSVWVELYLHLGVVYFVIFLITKIITNTDSNTVQHISQFSAERKIYVVVFLILALFFFAKKAPKFIADSLGIKSESFGDIMKMAGTGLGIGAGIGLAGAGMIGSGLAGANASYRAQKALGRNGFAAGLAGIAGGVGGALGGAFAGSKAALTAKDHKAKAALDAVRKRNADALKAGAAGSTLFGRMGEGIRRDVFGETSFDKMEYDLSQYDAQVTAGKQLQEYLEDRAVKKNAGSKQSIQFKDSNGFVKNLSASINEFDNAWETAKQNGASTFTVGTQTFETYGSDAKTARGELIASAGAEWASSTEGKNDSTLHTYQTAWEDAGGDKSINGDSNKIKKAHSEASEKAFGVRNSKEYKAAKANAGNMNMGK